jgi:hypothetical protein
MDQPQSSAPILPPGESQPDPEPSDELAALRSLLNVLLVAVICLALGGAITISRQLSAMNGQLAETRRLVDDYQTNTYPKISNFAYTLNLYAKTNRDFLPILEKYRLTINEPAATPSAPAPAAPATKK